MSGPVISPNSASYPVRGAAIATGVDYSLALRWVDSSPDRTVSPVRYEIIEAHGLPAFEAFSARIEAAWMNGWVRVPRWAPKNNGWRP